MTSVRIVDPSGGDPAVTGFALPSRPDSLAGARIAVLDNGKPNAGHVVTQIAAHLGRRHNAQEIRHAGKAMASRPCPDEVLVGFRGFDVAVVGVGD